MFIQIYHIGVVCRAVQLSERKFSVILIRCPESRRGNKSRSDILQSGLYATLARKEYSVLVDLSVLLRIVSIESDTSQGSCYECLVMLHLNNSYLVSLSSYTVISFFCTIWHDHSSYKWLLCTILQSHARYAYLKKAVISDIRLSAAEGLNVCLQTSQADLFHAWRCVLTIWMRFELMISAVTGRCSDHLNYQTECARGIEPLKTQGIYPFVTPESNRDLENRNPSVFIWWHVRDSNSRYRRERAVS